MEASKKSSGPEFVMSRDTVRGLFTGLVLGILVGAGLGLALGRSDNALDLEKQKYEGFKQGIEFACHYTSHSDECSKNANVALVYDQRRSNTDAGLAALAREGMLAAPNGGQK
jgi:hypothetical protein